MDELIELERAGWTSLCDGTGDDFYGRTMTSDGVMVPANGSVMTRDDVGTGHPGGRRSTVRSHGERVRQARRRVETGPVPADAQAVAPLPSRRWPRQVVVVACLRAVTTSDMLAW